MSEPIILNPNDNVAVLTTRASAGDDPLHVGAQLRKTIAMEHKIARVKISNRAPVLKFGQFIGSATSDIETSDHIHVHNCSFAEPEQDYAIGVDLPRAISARSSSATQLRK